MDLTRRDLLKLLLASAAAEAVDVEKLLWIPKPIITVPSLPDWMHGIPYHQSNASTGMWFGFERTTYPQFKSYRVYSEIIQLVNKLKIDKENNDTRIYRY